MKVSALIEWLKTQDQEAVVQVIRHTSGTGYYDQGGNACCEVFSPELSEYTSFKDEYFKSLPQYGTTQLLLGVNNG